MEKLFENRIVNLKESVDLEKTYSKYKRKFNFPDGNIENVDVERGVKEFLEEDSSDLKYYLKTDLNHEEKEIVVYLIPLIKSA